MSKIKATPMLVEVYTVSCCTFRLERNWRHDAVDALLRHIRAEHPALTRKLDREARRGSRSQNGAGYYDSGKPDGDGWHKAPETFRDAWRRHALEEILKGAL